MASNIQDLNAAITALATSTTAVIKDVNDAFGRLKNIDYTAQVTQITAQVTALTALSTTAKTQ